MFDYDDINLIPNKCVINSRSECDTSKKIGKKKFKLPIVPANMEAVIDEKLALKLAINDYFYIMHRFNINAIEFITNMKNLGTFASISIGVSDADFKFIDQIKEAKDLQPEYITIDIAHGHAIKMEKMIKKIKDSDIKSFTIAGNVSSPEACGDLEDWGADGIKVGIGPGCFIKDANVLTTDGWKKINDIEVGDLVLTHKNRYRKVLQTHEYDAKENLIQINNLPPSTKKHEYYVINKNDKILINDENLHNYAYWVEAQHLNKDKHLLIKY